MQNITPSVRPRVGTGISHIGSLQELHYVTLWCFFWSPFTPCSTSICGDGYSVTVTPPSQGSIISYTIAVSCTNHPYILYFHRLCISFYSNIGNQSRAHQVQSGSRNEGSEQDHKWPSDVYVCLQSTSPLFANTYYVYIPSVRRGHKVQLCGILCGSYGGDAVRFLYIGENRLIWLYIWKPYRYQWLQSAYQLLLLLFVSL
jgi:hypothetical protein